MNPTATRELLNRYFTAREDGDFETVQACLSNHVVMRPPQSLPLEEARGREQVMDALKGGTAKALGMNAERMERKLGEFIVEGGRAAVPQDVNIWTTDGRHYTNSYLWIYECEGGVITAMDEFTDTLAMARFFGWGVEQSPGIHN